MKEDVNLSLVKEAIDSTSCGVLITDMLQDDNPIIFSNESFHKLTGYSKGEILGKNCRFLQGEDRDQEIIKEIREAVINGEEFRGLIKNYKKNGVMFWNELTLSPIKDSKGIVTHFVGIQNDVTKRVKAEDELIKTNKELKKINDVAIDREHKMIELKKRIKELEGVVHQG